ncbi:MAG: Malonyl-[acyl-carrier protein] O-methyltransferase [Betaproteobacteria bacterium]|nr:Malonyl-[acyl-carrier protein] O-methyltransferase [Betaproteobacteria bacterium]
MDNAVPIDKRRVRESFDKAARGYDAAAVLQHEVCRRMLSRLEFVKLQPAAILDAGCGTGNVLPDFYARFPRAQLCALDIAPAMLREARGHAPWLKRVLGRGMLPVCGDIEHLPLKSGAFDLVWSNLALQWVNDPPHAFIELRRALAPGGLLMFSTLGPDTLKELRAAYADTDRYTHVNRFIDMHDVGDMLVHAGFADPVMDMEYITLTYADVRALMHDLKAIGAHNANAGRRPGMTARATLAAVERNYERFRKDDRLPATFEVIYGHAWVPQKRTTPEGKPVIEIKPLPVDKQ